MNKIEYDKSKKNCLLIYRNKKINFFDGAANICAAMEKEEYYFDKISFVAFDDSHGITFSLKDALDNYENIFVLCPKHMEATVKNFFTASIDGAFDENDALKTDKVWVFVRYSDGESASSLNKITQELNGKYGVNYKKAYIKTVGAPPAKINSAFEKAKKICPDITARISENYGDCKVEILYGAETVKIDFDKAYRLLVSELYEYVYALEDIPLVERLIELLKLRNKKIGFAESFTGGGVGKRIVDVPGASEVYYEGLNTYSNAAKSDRLGVKEETLRKFGAVSKQTAFEMAGGLLKRGGCDITVATTGIAGPKSDGSKKPVGLMYIAVGHDGNVSVYEYNLNGTRKQITETAINYALFLAFKSIK